ncbi:MAG: aspartate 1-decarboxylase [Acidobacteriota bacterium]|nr:aspartate 1-decarboxylase [Thermoanaerobaculaceae bacterium]
MLIEVLKSKIHRAKVTDANLDYEGSFSIDKSVMKNAGIFPFEAVEIYNITNGSRIKTYAIEGKKGEFCANGAAAHHIKKGDIVIICAYAHIELKKQKKHKPVIIQMDKKNDSQRKGC